MAWKEARLGGTEALSLDALPPTFRDQMPKFAAGPPEGFPVLNPSSLKSLIQYSNPMQPTRR